MKKKVIIISMCLLLITISTICTYAFFNANTNGNSLLKNTKIDMSKVEITFNDNNNLIEGNDIRPGWTCEKEITITNTGNVDVNYDLVWKELENEIEKDELIYTIEYDSNISNEVVPYLSAGKYNNKKIFNNIIKSGESQTYKVNFEFKNINANQNYNENKIFSGEIGIKEHGNYEEEMIGTHLDENYEYELNEENNTIKLKKYIGSSPIVNIYSYYELNDKKYIPSLNSGWSGSLFKNNTVVENITFYNTIDVNANGFFSGCTNLKKVDFSKADSVKMTLFQSMFAKCSSLTEIKGMEKIIPYKNPSINRIAYMFQGCSSLKKIDLTFLKDYSIGMGLTSTFSGCSSLEEIDLTGLTSKIDYLGTAFDGCSSLKIIKGLENLNVSTPNMSYAFRNCNSLEELDLSNWDLSQVTNMGGTFLNCTSLKTLKIPTFNPDNLQYYNMFSNNINPDILIETNEKTKIWLNEKYPQFTNITVV